MADEWSVGIGGTVQLLFRIDFCLTFQVSINQQQGSTFDSEESWKQLETINSPH